jgi:23S rRNA (uridine2552-2'-O)-methyltransferase
VKDEYAKKAQKEGYRARSVYKFFEIQERFQIVKPDSKVIDIGAAP